MTSAARDLVAWANAAGMRATLGTAATHELAPLADSPSINFGRWQQLVPAAVVAPADEAQLVALIGELRSRELSSTTRGRGHCSGSLGLARSDQILIDLSSLAATPLDGPEETLSIHASATLEDLVDALGARGRRPLGLTTNLAQSVGGTIAVGGFTESCHLHGLFADAVAMARVLTPAGELVEATPGDACFDVIPGGVGEHGILTAVALRSAPGRLRAAVRMMRWRTLEDFVPDALRVAQLRLYGYFRPRIVTRAEWEVEALVGNYVASERIEPDRARSFLHPSSTTDVELLDLEAALRAATRAPKPFACPAVELVFPFPHEQDRALAFAREGLASLGGHLPRGIALALVPRGSRFPHAPLPPDGGLMVAVRPELPPRAAAALVPSLRALVARTLEKSAALVYRVSI